MLRSTAYLYPVFVSSHFLNNISPWQKTHFRGNIALPKRKPITLGNFSDPVPSNHITDGSVYIINTHCIIPTKGINQIRQALTQNGLKHTWVASDGCNRLRCVFFVNAPDLDDIFLKMMQRTSECATGKDATDFLNCRFLSAFD